MLTISGIARRAGIARRTVQFWADQGALQASLVAGDTSGIRAYSERELEIARMLRSFSAMNAPISLIKFLAAIFRDWVLDPDMQTDGDIEEFRPLVKAARAGKPAFLAVAITPTPQNPKTMGYVGDLYAAANSKDLGHIIAKLLKLAPERPVVPINLTDALHPVSASIAQRSRHSFVLRANQKDE